MREAKQVEAAPRLLVESRVWHLGESATDPDEDVAALFEHAADVMLRRGDGAGAVATLTRAAALSPQAGDRARRLGCAAYIGTTLTGDLRNAEALLADISRTGRMPARSAETALADASMLLHSDGDMAGAHRLAIEAIEAARQPGSRPETLQNALATLVLICQFGGQPELWESFHQQAAALDSQTRQSLSLRDAVCADPASSVGPTLNHLDTEIAALPHMSDPAEIIRIAGAAVGVDRLPGCRRALQRVVREGQEQGAATSVIQASTLLAVDAHLIGQWDEAERRAKAAIELGDSLGYQLLRWNAFTVTVILAAARGDANARDMADELVRWAAPRGVRRLHTGALYANVLTALAQCDYETAYRDSARISPAGQLAPHERYAPWVILDLVEAALATDRSAEAVAHIRAIQVSGIAKVSSRLALLGAAATAMAAPDDTFMELFRQALAVRNVERWPFDLARVHLLFGERLRRLQDTSQARVHLDTAFDSFQRLGAKPWAERAATALRAAGRARLQQQHYQHEALTPQEQEIALLAASGLSNKQIATRLFLSHRTVGAHLYRVYPKLGIVSRAALRDALGGLVEPQPQSA